MKRTLAFLLVLTAVAGPALGDSRRLDDPRDSEGPFDVRRVAHAHNGRHVTHSITTHAGWTWHDARCFRTSSKCRAFFRIYLYKTRFGDYRRYVEVFRRQGKTYGFVYRFGPSCFSPTDVCYGQQPETVGRARVSHPDPTTVRMSFPKRFLPSTERPYFWSAYVIFWRRNECSNDSGSAPRNGYFCWDHSPNRGAPPIKHRV